MNITKIVIADYDSRWPNMFEEEKERLLRCINPWVINIEHIGSTAVPGLAAKPVIDIMISVEKLSNADMYCLQPIAGLGYEYVKEYEKQMPYRRYFQMNSRQNMLEHHIHLVEERGEFWGRHIAFRNYLRVSPETAREYEKLKRQLAPQFSNANDYAAAKTNFIKNIEAKALKV